MLHAVDSIIRFVDMMLFKTVICYFHKIDSDLPSYSRKTGIVFRIFRVPACTRRRR